MYVSMIKCLDLVTLGAKVLRTATNSEKVFPSELSAPLLAPFKIATDKDLTEEGAFARSYQPAERAGGEEDMAGMILFLASRAGAFVNGSIMLIDGGKLSTMPATY
jgi:NAD(P)-dependent dehydrogenase (short-subunit alcohol dehydrogenase family)